MATEIIRTTEPPTEVDSNLNKESELCQLFNVYYKSCEVQLSYICNLHCDILFIYTVISTFWICLLVLQIHYDTLWIYTVISTFWIHLLVHQIHNLHCSAPGIQSSEFFQHSRSNLLNSSCVSSGAHKLCRGPDLILGVTVYVREALSLVFDGLGRYPICLAERLLDGVVPQQVS